MIPVKTEKVVLDLKWNFLAKSDGKSNVFYSADAKGNLGEVSAVFSFPGLEFPSMNLRTASLLGEEILEWSNNMGGIMAFFHALNTEHPEVHFILPFFGNSYQKTYKINSVVKKYLLECVTTGQEMDIQVLFEKQGVAFLPEKIGVELAFKEEDSWLSDLEVNYSREGEKRNAIVVFGPDINISVPDKHLSDFPLLKAMDDMLNYYYSIVFHFDHMFEAEDGKSLEVSFDTPKPGSYFTLRPPDSCSDYIAAIEEEEDPSVVFINLLNELEMPLVATK